MLNLMEGDPDIKDPVNQIFKKSLPVFNTKGVTIKSVPLQHILHKIGCVSIFPTGFHANVSLTWNHANRRLLQTFVLRTSAQSTTSVCQRLCETA